MNRLSRRAFLGTAGAATLVAVPRPRFAGADETPGAVERLTVDVAVIGDGLNALAAAGDLAGRGLDVAVLGASGDADHGADGFGGWISDAHERAGRLARRTRSLRAVSLDGRQALEAADGGARPVDAGSLSADGRVASEITSALTKLDRMAWEVDVETPWAAVNAPVRDAHTLGSWLDGSVAGDAARRRLESGFELALGAPPSEVSLLFALVAVSSAGGASQLLGAAYEPSHEVEGGPGRLADSLADGLNGPMHSCAVHAVAVEGDHVVVTGPECVVEARRVVVAEPGASVVPDVGPSRPFTRGVVAAAVCGYRRTPWRGDGLSGRVLGDGAPVHAVQPTDGGHTLVVLIAGGAARDWLRRGEDDRRDAVLGALGRWLGPQAADPSRYRELSDVSGARVVSAPGAITALGPDLREPAGPVHWAGPETPRVWIGHAEGLIEAGERAAAQVAASLGA